MLQHGVKRVNRLCFAIETGTNPPQRYLNEASAAVAQPRVAEGEIGRPLFCTCLVTFPMKNQKSIGEWTRRNGEMGATMRALMLLAGSAQSIALQLPIRCAWIRAPQEGNFARPQWTCRNVSSWRPLFWF